MVFADSIPVRALFYRFYHFMDSGLFSSQGLYIAIPYFRI